MDKIMSDKECEEAIVTLLKKLSIKNKIRMYAFAKGLLKGQENKKLTGN